MFHVIFKALLIWMLIAGAEVLHGILRVRLLNRRVGESNQAKPPPPFVPAAGTEIGFADSG